MIFLVENLGLLLEEWPNNTIICNCFQKSFSGLFVHKVKCNSVFIGDDISPIVQFKTVSDPIMHNSEMIQSWNYAKMWTLQWEAIYAKLKQILWQKKCWFKFCVICLKCFILDRRYMIQMSVLWTDLLKAEMQIYGRLNIKGLYACSALIWKCWKVFLRPNFSHFRSHCAVNISALLNTSAAKNPNLFGANWQTCEGCWSWNCWHIWCCENIFCSENVTPEYLAHCKCDSWPNPDPSIMPWLLLAFITNCRER